MYDRLTSITYPLNAVSLAGAATFDIPLPPGVRTMRVLDIVARVTTTVNGDTTPPAVQVGRAGSLSEFAALTIPDNTAAGTIVAARSVASGRVYNSTYVAEKGGTAVMNAMRVTIVAATGAAAGVADLAIVVGVDYVKADDGSILA